tara:strand:+ start:131 stop:1030 length:900 start_codon:yes stop_codon:yes gene_type:complete
MRSLSNEHIWSFVDEGSLKKVLQKQIPTSQGVLVENYRDLATKVAELQFRNPNYVLFFRGQDKDYRLRRQQVPMEQQETPPSTIRPSIFRDSNIHDVASWPGEVGRRYDELEQAAKELIQLGRLYEIFDYEAHMRLTRSAVLRWAILQHYEVCDTSLLDVTHSLRIAASVASLKDPQEAFLMVLAAPQISGSVSVCAYNEMQILRLSSLCPSSAMRPHFQEGYLLGEYPELRTFGDKKDIPLHETDFANRLIGKFRFSPETFWGDPYFPPFPPEALSLSETDYNDDLLDLTSQITTEKL